MAAKALGMKVVSAPFNGVPTDKIKSMLKEAGFAEDGKQQLFDGRTGVAFKEHTTVGSMYIIKLNHMIADKIHARSTGPYTMVTQQPLGGKAQNGGQRFGEMEVWALEAYGAANTLQEMLTIKSDDVYGRSKAYESIIKKAPIVGPKVPESFNVLVKELQGLSLKVDLVHSDKVIDAEAVLAENVKDEASNLSNVAVPEPTASDIDLSEETIGEEDFMVVDENTEGMPALDDTTPEVSEDEDSVFAINPEASNSEETLKEEGK
jgi:DNA-directed RNA polymerase subunit beta